MIDVDWMFMAPATSSSFGKEGVEKFPDRSTAPPTVANTGKLRLWRAELLATCKPPATDTSSGMVMFVNFGFPTNDKLPNLFALSPTAVKFGAEKEVNVHSSKVRDSPTVARDGTERDETFLKVALSANSKLGKLTIKPSPLAATLRPAVTFTTSVVKLRRRRLLLTSNNPTLFKLIPSRLVKKVLVMVILPAFVKKAGNVNVDRALRPAQYTVPTSVKLVKDKVDMRVKSFNVHCAPLAKEILAIELLVRPVMFTAPSTMKLPEIAEGPSRLSGPTTSFPITTLPATTPQLAIWVASACELIVKVAVA